MQIVIAVLALAFTMGTFWWMNWRRGKLLVGPPRSFAGTQDPLVLLFHLPFVFYNPAPTPIVVLNLRIAFPKEPDQEPISFIATVGKIANTDERAFATQFIVRGRDAVSLVGDFQRRPGGSTLTMGTHTAQVQAWLLGGTKWIPLADFALRINRPLTGSLLTFDNMAEDD